MYVIYSYFNTEQIQALLNAIVMLMGSGGVDGDYLALIRIASMLGLLVAVTAGFVRARGDEAGMYVVIMALFYSTLFIPRVTVTIQDGTGSGGAPVTVDNVPIGLAAFTAMSSKIGYWFTTKTETFFVLPDNEMKFSRHGLMGAPRALREASNATVQDPVLQQDVTNFMRDCINPELITAPGVLSALTNSRDIWTDLNAIVNPGRVVSLASGTSYLGCADAYTYLTPLLRAQATTLVSAIALKMSPTVLPATAQTMLQALLPASEGLIMTASATARDSILQRMMINLFNDTSKTMGQVMNDPTAVQNAMAQAMASASAMSTYSLMAKLSADTLPMIRNAIELVIIGVFPIILVIVIVSGAKGGMVLKSYVLTMLWVELWAPLYAIVNYIGTLTAAKQMKAALGGVDGVAVVNAASVLNSAISAEAVAGLLTISVPIIALALVKGGEVAMSGVVSGLTGPAQSAAQSVGHAAGMGNLNAGNVQWGTYSSHNTNSNKHDTDAVVKSGAITTRNDSGDMQTSYRDGTTTVSHAKHDALVSGQMLSSGSRELSSAASESRSAAMTETQAATKSQDAAFAKMVASSSFGGQTNSTDQGWDKSSRGDHSIESGNRAQTTSGSRFANGADTGTSADSQLRGTFGVGGDGAQSVRGGNGAPSRKVGVNIAMAAQQLQTYSAGIKKAAEANKSSEVARLTAERQAVVESLAEKLGYSEQHQGGQRNTSDVQASLREGRQHSEQAQARYEKANRLEESSRVLQSASAQGGYQAFADPQKFSSAEVQMYTDRLRGASSPAERTEILQELASRIGGAEIGQHATTYKSGSKVVSTAGGVEGEGKVLRADSRVADTTGSNYSRYTYRVPKGKTGVAAVEKPKELQDAPVKIGDQKSSISTESSAVKEVATTDRNLVAARTGYTDPDPRSSNSESVNKVANEAARMAGHDIVVSVEQMIGTKPTLEEHQAATMGAPKPDEAKGK